MSYLETLQRHNADLEKLIDVANSLPEAGSEGGGDIPAVVQPLEVTENGTYTAPDGVDGYSPVSVNVPIPEIKLQEKTITENGEYTADAGFDGLAKVLVNVESGGSGGLLEEPLVTSGTFTPTSTTHTFNHNLGVVPDCIMIENVNVDYNSLSSGSVTFAIGFRTGLLFCDIPQKFTAKSGTALVTSGLTYGIETSGSSMAGFRNANATSVTFGGSFFKLQPSLEYKWRAVRLFA